MNDIIFTQLFFNVLLPYNLFNAHRIEDESQVVTRVAFLTDEVIDNMQRQIL